MRSFASSMAVLGVGFLAAGIAWPHVAERMLQMLLATLACGIVGARLYRSALPVRMTHDTYSPFESRRDAEDVHRSPTAIRRIAAEIEAVGDPGKARRVAIPGRAVDIVFREASRRLAEHHGLSLRAPEDQGRIRGLVSEPTWALIGSVLVRPGAVAEATAYHGPVPLSELDRILDDLENL